MEGVLEPMRDSLAIDSGITIIYSLASTPVPKNTSKVVILNEPNKTLVVVPAST